MLQNLNTSAVLVHFGGKRVLQDNFGKQLNTLSHLGGLKHKTVFKL